MDRVEKRFWAKVDKSGYDSLGNYHEWNGSPCHIWLASKRNKGYGAFTYTDDTGRVVQDRAHRYVWKLNHGPIPDGLFVLHHCDYPPCCNDVHLYLGTNQQNVDDMMMKGRHVPGGTYRIGNYPTGTAHHRGIKVTAKQAKDARRKVLEEGLSLEDTARALAQMAGVSIVHARRVIRGSKRRCV